ncbi:MAG TPA: VOC family protein [Candidatus Saccharimonadales bacterium]|nr:VOC family protein [Candidatus Saccharimonadales bacterium]
MNKVELAPYIFFKGNCREAMEFYQSVFGGELRLQTMSQVPENARIAGSKPEHIMHARLDGGLVILMASDSQNASAHSAKVELSLSGSDETSLRDVFNKLSKGGVIKMALSKAPWGSLFGQLTDKYGVEWMLNIYHS